MEAGTGAPPSYTLAVTKRCLIVDLGLSEADLERPLAELRDSSLVIQQFIDQRSQLPIGQETVQGLQAPIVAYSLHAGADRALTWHDRESGLVWLLASRFHRSGQAEDSYPFFRSRRREQLLPTRDDYTRAFEAQARTFAQALMEDVPPLLAGAHDHPNTIQHGTIARRIPVRVVFEHGEQLPMITVAISQRLQPGDVEVPAGWLIQLAAAFLPNTPVEQLSTATEIARAPVHD
ncbi:MAG TPA: hypothetical protein VIL53_07140, partial [Solirubrobacterales bacterium]